jgi:hypothetical protein
MILLNDTDFFTNGDVNHLSTFAVQQPSLPSSLHPKDIATTSDDDETSAPSKDPYQPIKTADSYVEHSLGWHTIDLIRSFRWHIEPFSTIDDKQVLTKLQLLQNRVYNVERTLARRDHRDRLVFTCAIGYFLIQALLSVRRSMLN